MTINKPVDGAVMMFDKGFKVFPVRPNEKLPALDGWQDWAVTATEQKIRDYGTANPTHNWGVSCEPSGLVVIDIDNKKGLNGSETFKQLLSDHGEKTPNTFVVETPTGGYHLYFKGEGRNSAGALGNGIDTRGAGGLVVAPGSRIYDKMYVIKQDVEIPPIPTWLSTELAKGRERSPAPEIKGAVLEGERNHTLASIAGTLRARGLGYPVILATLQAANEHQLETALPDDEVEKIAASISKYEPKVAIAAAAFAPVVTTGLSKSGKESVECHTAKRDWIMKHRYIRGFVSLIISPGGVGKSAFTMLDAAAISTGLPLTGFAVPSPGAVWLYNTEDPVDETRPPHESPQRRPRHPR